MDSLLGIVGIIIGISLFIWGKLYLSGEKCKIKRDLKGKIVVITGGNTGIGKNTALGLAKQNATVILGCRDQKRSLQAIEEIRTESKNNDIHFMKLDLSDLNSIKEFVSNFKAKYDKLHILINNAGVIGVFNRETTKDGFESQFGVNYLGHFYLTNLLMDLLKKSGRSRVVTLSSAVHRIGKINWDDMMFEKSYYNQWISYAQSKLALVLFTKELQRKFDEENVEVKAVVLHPGVVKTEIYRHIVNIWIVKIIYALLTPIFWYFFRTPKEGAQTSLLCALEDFDKLEGGSFYENCKVKKPSKAAQNMENARKLWEVSEKLIRSKVGEH